MSSKFFDASGDAISASDRLLILLYFGIGASAALFGLLPLPDIQSPRLLLCALFGAVILFSSSSFGWLLLPICVFFFGFYAQKETMGFLKSFSGLGVEEIRQVICSMILLPAFFLTGTHGLCVSAALQNALGSSGPTAREVYQKEFCCVLLSALVGLAAVFYFYSQ